MVKGVESEELDLFNNLLEIVNRYIPSKEKKDVWRWQLNPSGIYETKVAYKKLTEETYSDEEETASKAYRCLWKNYAPNRAKAIVWNALKRKMPTKVELEKRGIQMANNEVSCPLCGEEEEFVSHVILTYRICWNIWTLIFRWMKVIMVGHNDPMQHLLHFRALHKQRRSKVVL